ncbi:hypothetical protein DWV37_09145 [Tannerella sp. AF04-6]|jgi:hypothetical protein|nr:hypothetical protein DWV37_09145 [Tannerella sp. AF04-6]
MFFSMNTYLYDKDNFIFGKIGIILFIFYYSKSLYKFCTGQVENFFRGCCCCVTGCLMNENGKKDRKKRKNDLIVFLC